MRHTVITLIPKVKGAVYMKDFLPISLTTVMCKVISRMIVNRLQLILDDMISPFQSAFVKGRLITDNFLFAHEISHYIKKPDKRKDRLCII